MKKLLFLTLSLLSLNTLLFGQEVLTPLSHNPELRHYWEQNPIPKRKTPLDTIRQLPFIDDFSDSRVIPNPKRWVDRSVFINSTFPINPPTIGVATFDGLNEFGIAYRINNGLDHGPADTLTSQPIDLMAFAVRDSIYLSFYLQSTGRGDEPERRDSLVLEFLRNDSIWVPIANFEGRPLDIFRQHFFAVNQASFLHEGFQFRFRNYASAPISGNVDHWHLDYVRLNRNRSVNDTIIEDISINVGPRSLLNEYTQMPYQHFLINPSAFLASTHVIRARNLSIARNTSYTFTATDALNGNVLFTQAPANFNFDPFSDSAVTYNSFPIPNTASDSFTTRIEYIVRTSANDVNRGNDTLIFDQKFESSYAYDDGTAEYGYGLNHATGQIAYKFKLAKPDTLVAVAIFFTQIRQDVSNQLFNLRIWRQIGEPRNPRPDELLYEQPLLRPRYKDSINQYYIYKLDSPQVVRDSVYIGWLQGGNQLLNIGIDRNNNANHNMFFRTGANWQQSLIPAAWMMRPIFGKSSFEVAVPTIVGHNQLQFYPNPASSEVNISNWQPNWQTNGLEVQIFDLQGKLMVQTQIFSPKLDISSLPKGMYFLHLTETSAKKARYIGKLVKI